MRIPRVALAVFVLATTGCAGVAASTGADPHPSRLAVIQRPTPGISKSTATLAPTPSSSSTASSPPTPSVSLAPTLVAAGATDSTTSLPYASDAYPSVGPAVAAGVVPWRDLPYRSPVDPDPTGHPAGTPAWCTADDLVLGKAGPPDGASAAFAFGWTLTARPRHRCSLQGYPTVRLSASDHSWAMSSVTPAEFGLTPGSVVDAQHDGVLQFRWGYDSSGYTPDVPPGPFEVSFELPHHGGTLTTVVPSTGWDVPGRTVPRTPTHLGRVAAQALGGLGAPVYTGIYAHPDSANIVAAKPIRLTLGQPLTYDVWLRPSTTKVDGRACFGYRERLVNWKTGTVVAEEKHEFDCADLANLPSAGRLFAMTMQVPNTAKPGEALEVEWQADTDVGPADSAVLQVRAKT